MLVLTRKTEQKIRIGNDIVISVLKIKGDQVSIGIAAPEKYTIVREELLQEAVREEAAQTNRESLVRKSDLPPLEKLAKDLNLDD